MGEAAEGRQLNRWDPPWSPALQGPGPWKGSHGRGRGTDRPGTGEWMAPQALWTSSHIIPAPPYRAKLSWVSSLPLSLPLSLGAVEAGQSVPA